MNIFFIILIALQLIGLGTDLVRHNQERIVKDNFLSSLIGRSIVIVLIYFSIKNGF